MIARALAIAFSSIAVVLFAAATLLIVVAATEASVLMKVLLLLLLVPLYGLAPLFIFVSCIQRQRSEGWVWACVGVFIPFCLFTSLGAGPGIVYLPVIPFLFFAAVAVSVAREMERNRGSLTT
jgi:hypothetical protein